MKNYHKNNNPQNLLNRPSTLINKKRKHLRDNWSYYLRAFVAQLGERKTKDLTVRGSIPRKINFNDSLKQ